MEKMKDKQKEIEQELRELKQHLKNLKAGKPTKVRLE
jgi:hypothetical protein